MTTLALIVTDAGRAEIVNATNTGTLPVVISEVALGTGRWTPDATATALNTELKRINTIGGIAVADDTIHLTMADYSSDVYSLGEFGLYTDTGVLFAIYSDAVNGITDKAADAALLIATDTVFTSIAPGTITVNGAGFTNPPASETVQGVMEIADQVEVDTGTDHTRAVTPQTLASILSMYLLSAGYNAADVLAKLLTVDGVGSGLDADLFQGLDPSSFYRSNRGIVSNQDWNTLLSEGSYLVSNHSGLNAPPGSFSSGVLRVERFLGLDTYIYQEYITHELENERWTRIGWGGNWGEWSRVSARAPEPVDEGSVPINPTQVWTPPPGLYNFVCDAPDVILHIYVGGLWKPSVAPLSGMYWCDGSNMLLENTSQTNAYTVHWQKK